MCAVVGRSYDEVSCVALSMVNLDLEVRLGEYAAARLAAGSDYKIPFCLSYSHSYRNAQFGDPSSRGEFIHLRLRVVTYVLHHAFG